MLLYYTRFIASEFATFCECRPYCLGLLGFIPCLIISCNSGIDLVLVVKALIFTLLALQAYLSQSQHCQMLLLLLLQQRRLQTLCAWSWDQRRACDYKAAGQQSH